MSARTAATRTQQTRIGPAPVNARADEAPRVLPAGQAVPRVRFLIGWAVGWAVVGFLVASGIAYSVKRLDLGPVLTTSVLFAEVVGFTALISARTIFPFFSRLPYAVRLALQVLTLISGTLFGSVAVLLAQPLFSLARFQTVVMIVLVNASLAVVVGIALHTYDIMRRQIEASYETIRQKEAMERELAIARDVQRELLPRRVPKVRGLELAGVCIPAVGVGGDYYDYLLLSEDRIGLVIADVSGKGIPAALLMAGLQASVRSLAVQPIPPHEVNHRLNEMLLQSTSASRYATLFYGMYDARNRLLTYSNAGHYPPLILAGDGATRLSIGGRPIGILDESSYGEGTRELGAGDVLALFTDGVVEAMNEAEQEYGEERLLRVLDRYRDRSLDEVIGAVLSELTEWSEGAGQHDDITLVLARVK